MPKVSVCIPAYNQIEHLRKTIDSVLSQTYTDYEIVITDDSPGNNVKDLVTEYALPGRIKYYKNERTLGSPENWNEVIRRSSGEYIKILHHDDWLNSTKSLAKYVLLLDGNPVVDFAFSATKAMAAHKDWDHVLNESNLTSLKKNILLLYSNNFIGAPSTTIFRRSVNMFFDNNLKWLVDIEFYIRMLSGNKNFVYTTEMLTVTYLAEGRVSDECENNKAVEVYEFLYVLQAIFGRKKLYSASALRGCVLKAIAICEKYGVKNSRDLDLFGDTGSLPAAFNKWLSLQNLAPLSAKLYRKSLHYLQGSKQ